MTRVGGYWREAATLIVAAKTAATIEATPKIATKFKAVKKSQNGELQQHDQLTMEETPVKPYDYKVLMMQRSKKNKFLPENYVFPGGTVSPEDFDDRWMDLFEKYDSVRFRELVDSVKNRDEPTPMFLNRPVAGVPAEVAFRICAIRECFEECGILFAEKFGEPSKTGSELTPHLTSQDLNRSNWRSRVHRNPGQFIDLCLENRLVPNVWALYEWSNWLTPAAGSVLTEPPPKPHRFDTMFYVCCADRLAENVRVDNREAVTALWESPGTLIGKHHQQKLEMIGPQLYELSRMCNFTSILKLQDFVHSREPHGLQRWMPVILVASDGIITLLPGDELYPKDPDYNGNHPMMMSSESMEAITAKSRQMNRAHRFHGNVWTVSCTIDQVCGHLMPVAKIYLGEGKL